MNLFLFAAEAGTQEYTLAGVLVSAVVALGYAVKTVYGQGVAERQERDATFNAELAKRDAALERFGDKMAEALADIGRRLNDVEKTVAGCSVRHGD